MCQTGSTPVGGFSIKTNREVVCKLAGPLAALDAAIMHCMNGCRQLCINEGSLVPQWNVASPPGALILAILLDRFGALNIMLWMLIWQARGIADGPEVHVTYGCIADTVNHLRTSALLLCRPQCQKSGTV